MSYSTASVEFDQPTVREFAPALRTTYASPRVHLHLATLLTYGLMAGRSPQQIVADLVDVWPALEVGRIEFNRLHRDAREILQKRGLYSAEQDDRIYEITFRLDDMGYRYPSRVRIPSEAEMQAAFP